MLRHNEIAVGFALASVFWVLVMVLSSDPSATYQICETNQYGKDNCSPHHLLYVVFWYGGYVFNASTITALATAVIGYFTYTLYTTSTEQARLTRESIDLANAEFISSHRPKIVVYGLSFFGAAAERGDPDEPIRVAFRFVNSGESRARIRQIGTKLVHLFKPTMPSEINFEVAQIDPPLEVQTSRHGFRLTADRINQEEFIFNGGITGYSLVCVGFIVYMDDNDIDRQMGFCRRYDEDGARWIVMDEPEYEYSY
jgi:hypothetical protein